MRGFDSPPGLKKKAHAVFEAAGEAICMAYVENRTPERYFVSRQNREAVPRPKFLTKNFESRAILSIIFCPGGGIGRRTRLKIELRKECGFDSHPGHQN